LKKVTADFFTDHERLAQNTAMNEHMPFLYHLILAKLQGKEEFLPEEDDAVEDDPADMLGTDNADLNTWVSNEATEVEPPLQPDGPNPPPKDCLVLLERDIKELKGGFLSRSPDPKVQRKLRFETVRPFHPIRRMTFCHLCTDLHDVTDGPNNLFNGSLWCKPKAQQFPIGKFIDLHCLWSIREG
jgi:hypothetical protein